MVARWHPAIEAAADTLGEMLVAMAEGREDHDSEELAHAVLIAALKVLTDAPPSLARLEEVGRALYAKLHNGDGPTWAAMPDIERGFWYDLATAAIAAADATLLEEAVA
jgi:hypothetical protein